MNNQTYSDVFYAKREALVRKSLGNRLDVLKQDLSQLYSPCAVKLMNIKLEKELTIKELLSLDADQRKQILSSLLYNDALWRLEASYLMLCIGMLNVAYSSLRSCLDTVVTAHIVENLDSEAQTFLTTGKVNPTKISDFIPEQYNTSIKKMKKTLGEWGVHSHLSSVQLGSLFGPNAFEKMVSQTSIKREQTLHPGFPDAAKTCIQAIGDVFLMFFFLMSKGTEYKAKSKNVR